MTSRVKLGRIWTVPIQGTYSLLVLVLIVGGMTTWQFRAVVTGYDLIAYALAGLFSALLFIWTVFAHETAHVLVARHFGAKVKGVTLSFLGGETAISGQPRSPWQGVAVAMSGPGASALCGAFCGVAAYIANQLHAWPLVTLSFAWVGTLCILLAIANMIPAAPLDGGHVLQAVIWRATGNRVRASAVAGFAGQLVGAALVLWAAWLALFKVSLLAALLTAVVGWPLWRGASATRRAARQRAQLGGLLIEAIMRTDAPVLRATEALGIARDRLSSRTSGCVVVLGDDERPRVIVSVERIMHAADAAPTKTVESALPRRAKLITATADEPIADVLERAYAKPKAAVVMAGDQLQGVLDPDDVRAALASHQETDAQPQAPSDTWPGASRTRQRELATPAH